MMLGNPARLTELAALDSVWKLTVDLTSRDRSRFLVLVSQFPGPLEIGNRSGWAASPGKR